MHLAVDEATGENLAAVISTNNWADPEILPDLLQQIDADIEQVSAEVTYDTSDCYDAIAQREAKPMIPPRKNAVIWHHGHCKAPPRPRMKVFVLSANMDGKSGSNGSMITVAL
jgi:hypothetical protein